MPDFPGHLPTAEKVASRAVPMDAAGAAAAGAAPGAAAAPGAGTAPATAADAPASPAGAGDAAAGIAGFPGPFPVGRYAAKLRDRLRRFARVCVVGEVTGARTGSGPNVYFELRDSDGALPCAMWRTDFERAGWKAEDLRDGMEVVAAGGCDFYPGSASASPSFRFRVQDLRPAGEGDLLARLDRLRRQLAGEGLFDPQKQLSRPLLPRRIGVVTAERSAARRDFLAGLARRSWQGELVWAYAPVQDRRAAPAIAQSIRDLAALGSVDVIVVTRGGGSIADLWAFCDETLCRTVALLPVPVISAVGHEVDRTLIDDVAAVSCSTPTHAAEAAVGLDCAAARASLGASAARIDSRGRAAVLERARMLGKSSRAPRDHLNRHRTRLHQKAREMRAASRRGASARLDYQRRVAANVFERKLSAARAAVDAEGAGLRTRGAGLERAARALAEREAQALRAAGAGLRAYDPERTLERGYALVASGRDPLTSAAAAAEAGEFDVHFADGVLPARVRDSGA
jgi:exodeoxyribonuclease VII large subunit